MAKAPIAEIRKAILKELSKDGTAVGNMRLRELIAARLDAKVTEEDYPDVGVVTPETDPEQPKTQWAYDPHIDPALKFDVGRAQVESLVDNALASGDDASMRSALETLKRMAAPYLDWAGKAERTSFEIDTVSLHVHERIDPATILSAVQKRVQRSKSEDEGTRDRDPRCGTANSHQLVGGK